MKVPEGDRERRYHSEKRYIEKAGKHLPVNTPVSGILAPLLPSVPIVLSAPPSYLLQLHLPLETEGGEVFQKNAEAVGLGPLRSGGTPF